MRIDCPNCGFSREVNPDKVPDQAELATCPKCEHKFVFRDLGGDRDEEFAFSAPPEAEASPPRSEPFPAQGASVDGKVIVPFEDLENFGFFPGMGQTIKRCLLSTALFFQTMDLRGLARPVAFGVLMMELALILSILWQVSGLPPLSTYVPDTEMARRLLGPQPLDPLAIFMLYPIQFVASLFLETALLHALLAALGGSGAGFEGTMRAVAYSNAVLVLTILPYGILIALIPGLAVQIVGMKHIHGTSYARAVGANALFLIGLAMFLYAVLKNMPVPA